MCVSVFTSKNEVSNRGGGLYLEYTLPYRSSDDEEAVSPDVVDAIYAHMYFESLESKSKHPQVEDGMEYTCNHVETAYTFRK